MAVCNNSSFDRDGVEYPCTGCDRCEPSARRVPSKPEPQYACANTKCKRGTATVWPNAPGKMCVHCQEREDAKPEGTKLCTNFNKVGSCKFGTECYFLHQVCPCRYVERGEVCPFGDRCNFGGRHEPQNPIEPSRPLPLVRRPNRQDLLRIAAEEKELARANAKAQEDWYAAAMLQQEEDLRADALAAQYDRHGLF